MSENLTKISSNVKFWRPEGSDYELMSASGITGSMPCQISQDYILGVIEKGQAQISYRGQNYNISSSSFIVLHPEEVFSRQGNDESPRTVRMLIINPEFLQQQISLLTEQKAPPPQFDQPVVLNKQMIETFSKIHRALELPHSRLERDSWLQEIVGLLLKHCIINGTELPTLPNESERIKEVRNLLTQRYVENISLEELAAIVNLSPYRLNRIFSKEVGIPPHAFLNQVRVWEAKALLEKSMPIAEVAIETGFYDQSHLTRHFKRIMGYTPSVVFGNLK